MIGTYGMRAPNHVVMRSDVLVVLGSRLKPEQTGFGVKEFEKRTIYHVEVK